MNWKQTEINLGTIKEKSSYALVYTALKPLDVIEFKPGCGGCTFIKSWNKDKGELKVTYNSDSIPKHLSINPGYQKIRKIITVTYQDSTKEILSFVAFIKK